MFTTKPFQFAFAALMICALLATTWIMHVNDTMTVTHGADGSTLSVTPEISDTAPLPICDRPLAPRPAPPRLPDMTTSRVYYPMGTAIDSYVTTRVMSQSNLLAAQRLGERRERHINEMADRIVGELANSAGDHAKQQRLIKLFEWYTKTTPAQTALYTK